MIVGPLFNKLTVCQKKIIACQGGGDAGKCLGINTPILLYDLNIKKVQDIVKGDQLMGIDGTPRTVLTITKGVGQLYKVKQKRGIDFVVNDAHILCLKHSEGKELYKTIKQKKVYQGHFKMPGIHKITAEDLYNSSGRFKRQYRGFKTGFELPERKVLLDAYYLGLWLGDGCSSSSNITTVDKETRDYLYSIAEENNCIVIQNPNDKNTIRISRPKNLPHGKRNLLIKYLTHYGLIKNKHIPHDYLHNTIEVRKKLLAGLIDSDGTLSKKGYYSISTTKQPLAEQIRILVSSLGYYASVRHRIARMKRKDNSVYSCDCWSINISCNNGESIPTLIKRKQKVFVNKVCDCLNSTIELEKLTIGDYYGFTLDGDHMFLLGDFTVTHNTSDILKFLSIESIQNERLINTVTGQDLPNLKVGPLRLFQNYIEPDPEINQYIKTFNKSENTFTFYNDSIIEFKGFENEQDARGSERDNLFINEVNSRSYNLFWQLQRKTRKRVIMDYNPTGKFWVHHKLLNKATIEKQFAGKVQLYITDHRHNPFLTLDQHEDYESISDPELFLVYARGRTGKLKGTVYRFTEVDKIPEGLEYIFGIDLGYTTDKCALVKIYIDGRNRYWQQLLYKSENEILEIIEREKSNISPAGYMAKILKANGCTTSSLVWGDHDKKYSTDFRRLDIPYRMARKGPNSVTMGISKVKEFKNFYYKSPDLANELETYRWQTGVDILTGEEVTIAVPVEGVPDHLLDAGRYPIYSHARRFAEAA